jgi:hypothetical protein
MRPEGLEAKNKLSNQASWLASIPAFELTFLLGVFVIVENVSNSQYKSNYFEISLREPNG